MRKLNTPNTRSLLKLVIIFTTLAVFFGIDNITNGLVFGASFFLFSGCQIYMVILKPKIVSISNDEIDIGTMVVNWNNVASARFDRPIYSPEEYGYQRGALLDMFVPNQIIELTLKNHDVIKIYPRIYSEGKLLRREIERIVQEKGINYSIRDRSLL